MGESGKVARRGVLRHESGETSLCEDGVAVEEPLEIRVDGVAIAVTMRTPDHDEELAAGFCWTEAIVAHPDDLESIQPCALADYGNVVDVELTPRARAARGEQVERARRELYLSSSCGLCGKQSIDRIEQVTTALSGDFRIAPELLAALPERMRAAQGAFAETGGLHAAALFDPDGALIVLREDVGRHNAVDKVIGHELLLGRLPLDRSILLVSGRASFEIVQKAATAGIAMLCAVSAPSSLAVDLAERLGMTLVGFLRPGRMNLYSDRSRVA